MGIYTENVVSGPRALLIPASITGSVGFAYMACRQLLKDYIKKLEQVKGLITVSAVIHIQDPALSHLFAQETRT